MHEIKKDQATVLKDNKKENEHAFWCTYEMFLCISLYQLDFSFGRGIANFLFYRLMTHWGTGMS